MNSKLEQQFEALAEEVMGEAESVECSMEEFLAGLIVMRDRFRSRIAEVEEELQSETPDAPDEDDE